MSETNNNFNKEESLIKYAKPKFRVFVNIYLFIIGLAMFIYPLVEIIDTLMYNKINFHIIGLYATLIFASLMLLISINSLLSYFGNKIYISDGFIKIKKASLGRMYLISKKCVIGKKTIVTRKGMDNYQILLYLRNGKKINTGLLNCKSKDFNKIDNKFDFKKIRNKNELKEEQANYEIEESDYLTKTNYLIPIISFYTPLIVLIIIISLLSSGYNHKYGEQDDFQVNGIVIDMNSEGDSDNTDYTIVVLEDYTLVKHKIDVSRNTYNKYEINSKIHILGTRGSLGIIYGIRFL
ncbi:hypothetical protein AN1V17_16070 [Vallitalea sediminicola]